MTIYDLSNVFGFFGGLAMFLYGMGVMGDGMQKTAGSRMNQFLGLVTNNRFLAVALGALITAILHSSSATTVMVVGFVNAGILTLTQAVGVIMGANIGTTITAWMVSLNQLGDAFEIFKPSFFAPLCVAVGVVMMKFLKKQKSNVTGEIFLGVGLLFVGLNFMSDSVGVYADAPVFSEIFRVLGGNPVLGVLSGAAITAIIQSSTASVSILQTLAMNGVVNTSAAIYITLGQNIGTCVTAVISSTGTNRTAKRAACIHLMFNTIGAVIFTLLMYGLTFLAPEFAHGNINAVEISMFHTIFNVTNTLLLFPFADKLVKLSGLMVKESRKEEQAEGGQEAEGFENHLDERIFESPVLAVETALLEIVHMGELVKDNVRLSADAVIERSAEKAEVVYKNEKIINNMEKSLMEYLIKIHHLSLTEQQNLVVSNLFYAISDIERMGDHAENLADHACYLSEHQLTFSETGIRDLEEISRIVAKSVGYAVEARQGGNMDAVRKVIQYEDEVDSLEEEMREKHIERLADGRCNPSAGVIFLDIISNLERISDHAYNIAGYVKNEM